MREVNFNEGFTLTVEAQDFSILRQTFEELQDFLLDAVLSKLKLVRALNKKVNDKTLRFYHSQL